MRWIIGPILAASVLLAVGGCASDERQWLKLDSKYTTEEFRRDHASCSKTGKLDDACMRSHGWVAVNPSGKAETSKDPYGREIGVPTSQRRGVNPGQPGY
jgi:hypothetical protein